MVRGGRQERVGGPAGQGGRGRFGRRRIRCWLTANQGLDSCRTSLFHIAMPWWSVMELTGILMVSSTKKECQSSPHTASPSAASRFQPRPSTLQVMDVRI